MLTEIGTNTNSFAKFSVCRASPWLLHPASSIFTWLLIGSRDNSPPDLLRSKLDELLGILKGYERICADASEDGPAAAAAAVSTVGTGVKRLPNDTSIFSGETWAVVLALDVVELLAVEKFVILSNSLSCLQCQKPSPRLILEIVVQVRQIILGQPLHCLCVVTKPRGSGW